MTWCLGGKPSARVGIGGSAPDRFASAGAGVDSGERFASPATADLEEGLQTLVGPSPGHPPRWEGDTAKSR